MIGFLAVLVAAVVVGIWGFRVWSEVNSVESEFVRGISIDGISLEGKTKEEAIAQLTQRNQVRLAEMRILLRYGEREWMIDSSHLDAKLDIERQVTVAWQRGHEGNFWKRSSDIQDLKKYPLEIETEMTYNATALTTLLEEIKQEVDTPVVNASMKFDPDSSDKFSFVPEQSGKVLDIDAVYKEAIDMVESNRGGVIDLAVRDIEPEITVSMLEKATTRVVRFKTGLGSSSKARIENIKLALSNFNGMTVMPGERISFNEITGERSPERGYQDAPQIYGNNLVDGPGGGVCQASTTLYQAWMRAGYKKVSRSKHSIPSSYVDKGQDAAVAYDYKDLKLENDSDLPIFIHCGVDGNEVFVALYGRPIPDDMTIKIESEVLREIPAVEPDIVKDRAGEYVKYTDQFLDNPPSRKGFEVKTYRLWIDKNGKTVKTEQLTHDTYEAKPGTRYVGVTDRNAGSSSTPSSSGSGSGSGSGSSSTSTPSSGSSSKPAESSATPKPEKTATPETPKPAPEDDASGLPDASV